MVAALIIGRAGSSGFKGKNLKPVLGRPMMVYPLLAALNSRHIDKVFFSTDSDEMKAIATGYGAEIIDRPGELATKEALSINAFEHGYFEVKRKYGALEFFVPMFANGGTITPGILDRGIEFLRANTDYDSAVTVSAYNMFSALRARKIDGGLLKPFVPPELFNDANCDRDSQGDTYFVDCSGFITTPLCMEDFTYGDPPFQWIGKKVHPLKQWGGIDIDYEWQLGQYIYWLHEHGFTEDKTPYDK